MFTLYNVFVYLSSVTIKYNCKYAMFTLDSEVKMKLRIKEILDEKKKTKYWLFIQLGLSYQNFNRIINNETSGIKFDNLKALCDILECTPNDLFDEYHSKP